MHFGQCRILFTPSSRFKSTCKKRSRNKVTCRFNDDDDDDDEIRPAARRHEAKLTPLDFGCPIDL